MERFGVRFGVYINNVFNEQLLLFDSVPRLISRDNWAYLEQGLMQRVQALNKSLWDIYHEKKILKDGVVPEGLVHSSKSYMTECEGISPKHGGYAHRCHAPTSNPVLTCPACFAHLYCWPNWGQGVSLVGTIGVS